MSKVYGELNPPVRLLLGPGPSSSLTGGLSSPYTFDIDRPPVWC